jgi:hypothetical protein
VRTCMHSDLEQPRSIVAELKSTVAEATKNATPDFRNLAEDISLTSGSGLCTWQLSLACFCSEGVSVANKARLVSHRFQGTQFICVHIYSCLMVSWSPF